MALSVAMDVTDAEFVGLLDVDAALERLERIDARKAHVATLRLFSGASWKR